MLKENKKAVIDIGILVFMVLVLVIYSLFTFITSESGFKAKVSDARVVEFSSNVYDSGEYYINLAGNDALIESYFEIVNEGSYAGGNKNSIGDIEFKELRQNVDSEIEKKFTQKFKENFNGYEFTNSFMLKIKEAVNNDEFRVVEEGEGFKVILNSIEFGFASENVKVIYFPEISSVVDLEKIGLNSFDEIYTAKEKCKKEALIKECFENELKSFNTLVSEKREGESKYNLVTLKSKNGFLVDSEFKSLEMGFVCI